MDDERGHKVLIREFSEESDADEVTKLEKNCEIGSKKGISIFTSIMGDPLCRIRLYPFHVMLVAEMLKNRELVGIVQGCIKDVGTGFVERHVKLGCILGLRVSPRHRRMGIGLKLVQAIEEWMTSNGAQYTFLATEEKNLASTNLFTQKCNYVKFSSLVIYCQQLTAPIKHLSQDIKIEKLSIDEAISFYKNRLRGKDIYPTDIDAILKEKLNLGTWVSYFKEEDWKALFNKQKNEDTNATRTTTSPSSNWAIISIWNTGDAYKLQTRRSYPFKLFHATLSHAKDTFFPCLKIPIFFSFQKPFGFLFIYGIHGEGERVGDLIKSLWSFATKLAENVKDCKAIMTELADSDPLREHISKGSSMSCINDLWYLKGGTKDSNDEDDFMAMRKVGNVFVDPRDF